MSEESVKVVEPIFSPEHLARKEEERLQHLLFCPSCGSGFELHRWGTSGSAGNSSGFCPDCGVYIRKPLTVAEIRGFTPLRVLEHQFVCSVCGNPYGTPLKPTQPFPEEEDLAPEKRCKRYDHPWTYKCGRCSVETEPVRASEFNPKRAVR